MHAWRACCTALQGGGGEAERPLGAAPAPLLIVMVTWWTTAWSSAGGVCRPASGSGLCANPRCRWLWPAARLQWEGGAAAMHHWPLGARRRSLDEVGG